MNLKEQSKILTLGNFDGLHLAHQELFKNLNEESAILVIEKKSYKLSPKREKFTNFPIFYYNFEEIQNLQAQEFIEFLEKDFPALEKIVVGYDFRFGKNRLASAQDLKKFSTKEVLIIPEFKKNGLSVHSSLIKTLLNEGKIQEANELLGRKYELCGRRILGQNLGSKVLYPTINIETGRYFLPQNGVYATETFFKNKLYKSLTFIGNRKSTDNKFSVETHILGENIQVEAKEKLCLTFLGKIRNNEKFSSLDDLKEQIKKDINERYSF